MDKAKVIFLGKVRNAINFKEVELPIDEGTTISVMIEKLIKKFGEKLKDTLFDQKGDFYKQIIIRHNGENIVTKKGFKTEVKNNDTILIMPAVAGG